ncbi:MAG: hypothetical protein WCP20_08015 [Desulfuromonadales bacterium]
MKSNSHNIQDIDDQELAEVCLTNAIDGWNEFFRRFTPLFIKTIRSTLESHAGRFSGLSPDDDLIWDIQEKLVIRFYKEGLLSRCDDPSGIRSWLKMIAKNQARDWLKHMSRLKELPRRHFEESLQSLDAALYEDGDDASVTLHDSATSTIDPDGAFAGIGSDEYKAYHLERQFVDTVQHLLLPLKHSEKNSEQRSYWVARLSCMAPWQLEQDEIVALSYFNTLPLEETEKNIVRIAKDVERRESRRAASLGRAVAYWHTIRHYEARCNILLNDDSHKASILVDEFKRKISTLELQRQEALKIGLKIPRPSNRDIAELVGLPESQEAQVTVIFKRLRERLIDAMNTFIQ